MDVVNVSLLNKDSAAVTSDNTARIDSTIRDFAGQPRLYERLANSIAPSVWKMDDVKKGLLLQLFSGCSKNVQNFKFRGDINILLAGDPGVSKSQLLQVHFL